MSDTDIPRRRGRRGRQVKAERKAGATGESSKLAQAVSLELVGSSQAALIHAAVKSILWEIGVVIEHPPTRDLLVKHNACR